MEAEIAADHEQNPLHSAICEALQTLCESLARSGATVLIEGHQPPAWFELCHQGIGFEPQDASGILGATAGRRPQRTIFGRPSSIDPRAIGLDLDLEGARRRSAEPGDAKPHCGSPSEMPRATESSRGASPQSPSSP